jgi:hypothetical protein
MNVCGLQLRGQEVRMWRGQIKTIVLTGAVSAMLTAGFAAPSEALTPPVRSVESIAGAGPAEPVYYGWYYRRRYNPAGAFVAGAALGLIGAAAVASSYPYYGYYPAYYGYYPRAYYGYPVGYYRRAYYARPYWGYRRAYYARPYYGFRRAYWRRWY